VRSAPAPYHSALEVRFGRERFVIEMAPVWNERTADRGVDARCVLELVPGVPALVWGRDELGVGDMWNSNPVIFWVLARAGLDAGRVHPPAGGRAPGWEAGLAAARATGARGA
jgi:hypothetical protein